MPHSDHHNVNPSIQARCPVCLLGHRIDERTPEQSLTCDCGAVLTLSNEGHLVIGIETATPAMGASPTVVGEPSTTPSSKARRTSKTDWTMRLGIAAVMVFVAVACVVFAWRTSATRSSATAAVAKSPATQDASISRERIPAGTMLRYAAKLPSARERWDAPSSDVDSLPKIDSPSAPAPSATRSPFGGPTVAPPSTAPVKSPARIRLPLPSVEPNRRILSDVGDLAYASYETLMAMPDDDSDAYRRQLTQTLALVRDAYDWTQRRRETERVDELRYLLAYLSLKAGHVIEAAIYGEAAARWGDAKDETTRSAASIALAATQEASATQWAATDQLGELSQMRTIARLVDEKWPDDPQRDSIWMYLAARYAAFARPEPAIEIYRSFDKTSPQYGEAQLQCGFVLWRRFLQQASVPDAAPAPLVAMLKQVAGHLQAGLRQPNSGKGPSDGHILDAKLTLAKAYERLGNHGAAQRVLRGGKQSLVNAIALKGNAKKGQTIVSKEWMRSVLELSHRNQVALGDRAGADRTMKTLAALRGQEDPQAVLATTVGDAVAKAKTLFHRGAITEADVAALGDLVEPLRLSKAPSMSIDNQLWFAGVWASLATQSDSKQATRDCYGHAVTWMQSTLARPDFPAASRSTARRRLGTWARQAGDLDLAIEMVTASLQDQPSVLESQVEAALLLEQIAIQKDDSDSLGLAMQGMKASLVADSDPLIWGWGKLAVVAHGLRYSDRGDDRHARVLLTSYLHLARCHWLQGAVSADDVQQAIHQSKIDRLVDRAAQAIPDALPDAKRWRRDFQRLRDRRLTGASY